MEQEYEVLDAKPGYTIFYCKQTESTMYVKNTSICYFTHINNQYLVKLITGEAIILSKEAGGKFMFNFKNGY